MNYFLCAFLFMCGSGSELLPGATVDTSNVKIIDCRLSQADNHPCLRLLLTLEGPVSGGVPIRLSKFDLNIVVFNKSVFRDKEGNVVSTMVISPLMHFDRLSVNEDFVKLSPGETLEIYLANPSVDYVKNNLSRLIGGKLTLNTTTEIIKSDTSSRANIVNAGDFVEIMEERVNNPGKKD